MDTTNNQFDKVCKFKRRKLLCCKTNRNFICIYIYIYIYIHSYKKKKKKQKLPNDKIKQVVEFLHMKILNSEKKKKRMRLRKACEKNI